MPVLYTESQALKKTTRRAGKKNLKTSKTVIVYTIWPEQKKSDWLQPGELVNSAILLKESLIIVWNYNHNLMIMSRETLKTQIMKNICVEKQSYCKVYWYQTQC